MTNTELNNGSNSINNSKATNMETKINFLDKGTYDIMQVSEVIVNGKRSFPAKVRRWESTLLKTGWVNETVDLIYIYSKESNGPKLKFQPKGLVDHVIEIIERISNQSVSGKTYSSYNWVINEKLTADVQEIAQEGLNYLAEQDYQHEMASLDFLNEISNLDLQADEDEVASLDFLDEIYNLDHQLEVENLDIQNEISSLDVQMNEDEANI